MAEEYFINLAGETKGPYSLTQLRSMWEHGNITSDAQYWAEGMDDWYLVSTLFDVPANQMAVSPAESPASPAEPVKVTIGDKLERGEQAILSKANEFGRVLLLSAVALAFIWIIAANWRPLTTSQQGDFVSFLLLLGAVGIYFLPTIIGRKKRNRLAIFLLNLFFGWSLIGWVVALIWACTKDAEPIVIIQKY